MNSGNSKSVRSSRLPSSSALLALALVGGAALLSGCEKEEDRQVYAAQACLDQATNAATVNPCLEKIQGNESSEAYLIRCSAHFVAQEFTGPRMANAFQRIQDNPNSGTDPMATMMAYFVFSKPDTAHTADITLNDCQKSGLKSMIQLAEAAKLATFVAQSGLGSIGTNLDPTSPSFDQNAINTAIQNLANATGPAAEANKETVGNIAISMNQSYCGDGGSYKDSEVCQNLTTAVANGATAKDIGAQLLALLQQNN